MARYTFDEMDRLFDEMDRRFETMRRSLVGAEPRRLWGLAPAEDQSLDSGRTDVALDIQETEDGYTLVADLPGFEKEEIDLRCADGTLTISAEHEVEGEEYVRSRRVHERTTLPAGVDEEAITANYRNGVLEVFLPVPEGVEEGRRIDID